MQSAVNSFIAFSDVVKMSRRNEVSFIQYKVLFLSSPIQVPTFKFLYFLVIKSSVSY